ncbi:hypothetical protein Dimus_034506 [Dionaea muscipula]
MGNPIGIEIAEDEGQLRNQGPMKEEEQQQQQEDENVLNFMDSLDSYLSLLDSLSCTLRQGWFELASARHSMGASRINTALLDLKSHDAATSVQVTQHSADSNVEQPRFTLCKWSSCEGENLNETKSGEDEMTKKFNSLRLRHREASPSSGNLRSCFFLHGLFYMLPTALENTWVG